MSECVEKIPHSCGSNALQVFQKDDGKIDGYCFSCGTYEADPYGGNPVPTFTVKTQAERDADLAAIANYPQYALPTRKLRKDTLKYFGVRTAVSATDGETPVGVFFPYGTSAGICAYKFRDLKDKKRQWCMGKLKDASMFGWGRAIRSGQRTLYITEGEFDAMALFQILKDGNKNTPYADDNPAVVSVKSGAQSARNDVLSHQKEIRDRFEHIVLVFDQDKPGQDGAEQVSRILPEAKNATLPCKDANECLLQGASKAAKAAVLFRAVKAKNTRLVYGSTLRDVAMEPPVMGLSWPWEGLTDLTRGIRRQDTIYIGAGVKMGKSELVNTIAAHLILEHQKRVFLVKPEEDMGKSYKLLVGKAAGRIFHDPRVAFDQQAWDLAEPTIGDSAILCDAYQFVSWDQLKEDILYTVLHDGVQDVMIDPITCLTNQMSSSEANEKLVSLTAEISAMAKDHNFTAYIFCHLKAPQQGDPHERGGKVFSTQFAGSRAMMRSCNYMIGLRGNKDPELPVEERNMRYLDLLEDREFGASGTVPLYWDQNTGLFNEAKQ